MATGADKVNRGPGSRWTLLLWGGAALLLLLPFVAMRFTTEVDWSAEDFVAMGIMLGLACGTIELAVRLSGNVAYRFAVVAAIGAAFLITWANLAIGIVGSEDNPANLLFFYALLIGIAAWIVARFRPAAMAIAMLVTACAIAIAFMIAVSGVTDEPNVSHLRELIATTIIASPFLLSAWLFRKVARRG